VFPSWRTPVHSLYQCNEKFHSPENLFELFLRIQPDEKNEDPHNRRSKKFPGARIALWCNDHTDILEIESDGLDSFQEMQKELVYYSKNTRARSLRRPYARTSFRWWSAPVSAVSERALP